MARGRPWVTLKLGASLDGRTALAERREPVDHRRGGARRRAAAAGARVGDRHRHRHGARGRSGADRARPGPRRCAAAGRCASCSIRRCATPTDRAGAARRRARRWSSRATRRRRWRGAVARGAGPAVEAVPCRRRRARPRGRAASAWRRSSATKCWSRPARRSRAVSSRRGLVDEIVRLRGAGGARRRGASLVRPAAPLRALGERCEFVWRDVRRIGDDLRLTLRPRRGRGLMFTGIVQGVGTVRAIEPRGGDVTLVFDTGGVSLADVETRRQHRRERRLPDGHAARRGDASRPTCRARRCRSRRSATGRRQPGQPGEGAARRAGARRPLRHRATSTASGEVVARHDDARSVRMEFEVPPELARYVARKGSICVDGVSLTVNGVDGRPLRREPRAAHAGGHHARRLSARARASTSKSTSSRATSSG